MRLRWPLVPLVVAGAVLAVAVAVGAGPTRPKDAARREAARADARKRAQELLKGSPPLRVGGIREPALAKPLGASGGTRGGANAGGVTSLGVGAGLTGMVLDTIGEYQRRFAAYEDLVTTKRINVDDERIDIGGPGRGRPDPSAKSDKAAKLAANPKVRDNADRVAAVVLAAHVKETPAKGRCVIGSEAAKDRHVLCPKERFADVPVAAVCTAFLVRDDVVATAAHCIDKPRVDPTKLNDLRFVFPDRSKKPNENPWNVPVTNVYTGEELIAWTPADEASRTRADWALVRLDRKVADRAPVTLAPAAEVAAEEPVYMLGHPIGLPLTFDGGSKRVMRVDGDGTFTTNLDAYGGNSGSPVISARTHAVIGVLVTGEDDFKLVNAGGCNRSIVCEYAVCGDEVSTKVSVFAKLVQPNPPPTPRP